MSVEKQDEMIRCLCDIKDILQKNQEWTYKIMLVTIVGSFALVGIKLALP